MTVRKIDIRASCEEILGNREMPSEDCMEKQTAAVRVLPIHGYPFPQKGAHALQRTPLDRCKTGCLRGRICSFLRCRRWALVLVFHCPPQRISIAR
jgi:hypothetical protein